MSDLTPIRLLIADELPYSHGVENVSLALVREFLKLFEAVTWVSPRPSRARELEQHFPNSKNLRCISLFEEESTTNQVKKPHGLGWKNLVKRLPLIGRGARKAHRRRIDDRLRRICKENRCTHCFVNYALSQTTPKLEVPVVGLVHDLNFLHYPDNFAAGAPQELRRCISTWLQNADVVTVLSNAGKEEILSLAEINPRARVEIIPNAIKPLESKEEITRQKSDEPPTFLYPATALAHKNHWGLLQAALKLALEKVAFQVTMTGSRIDAIGGNEPLDNATVEKARQFYIEHREVLETTVFFRGARESDELTRLYREAHRVILPTQYEGFGLPLLEAISHGTRVLCSSIPQFREQVDRYDLHAWVDFFDPEIPDSMASAMKESLLDQNGSLPTAEVEKKLSKWQWKDSAQSYCHLFEELKPVHVRVN